MRTLHAIIRTKFILVALLFGSSVIIATTIPFGFDKGKEPLTKETKELKKKKNSIQPVAAAVNTKTLFAVSVNLVTPRSGTILGGTAVTISGSGFTPPNAIFSVKFDGVSATSVVRVSNSVITAVTPAHVAGTVSVTVEINGVETTADNLFTFVCNDPSPLIFTESIGSIPSGPPVSIADHESANGFDYDNYTMSGTGEIRSTPTSTGYLGASDAANVFLTNVPGTYFRIDGINTSGYANPQLSFGLFKTTTASDGSDLVVEVSGDGINFTALNFPPLPTGTGTTVWHYRIAGGTIPLSPDLSIRFRQNGSITQYRIDDIRLITSPIISSHPSNIVRCLGNPVSFSVVAIGNDLTYQWRKDGTEINGATASSYSISSGGYNDAGSYDVIVKETCTGLFTISNAALLTIDLTPPTIIVSGTTLNLGCNPTIPGISGALGSASASDNCGSSTITQSDGPVQSSGCNRSQTRRFTATDNTGSTSTAARTVTWVADLTPPVFIGSYATVNLGCNPAASSINAALDGATATDACGAPTLVSSDGAIVSNGCSRTQTRTFTAIDACGNLSTASRTVNWFADNIPPLLTISGGSLNLGCNPDPGDINAALGVASAFDACAAPTLLTTTGAVVANGCNRSQTRAFTSIDACGNFSSASRTAIWTVDITPPVFVGSYGTINLGCNPAAFSITAALGGATATDACGAPTLVSSDGAIVSNGCNRTQTRTFTAIDACGNISTASRTVIWIADITPPVFIGIYGTTVFGCNPLPGDIFFALGFASASDECSATSITFTDVVFSNGCTRTQVRTFTAFDACGNFSIATKVAIWTEDITPPVFIGSYATVNLGCNPAASSISAALDGATATDACGAPILLSSDGAIVSNGCNRTQTRTFTAIDGCGNISTASRTVNWFADNTPPLLTISGGSLNLGCNPDPDDINAALGVASAFDACAAPTLLTSTGAVVANGCNRSQTRTFTSIDACGNFSSASRTAIWVDDPTPPVFIGSYGTTNLGCNPPAFSITAALGGATATDACGVPTLVASDGAIVSNGCNRTQTRTFTAIDACGNISTASRTVNWFTDFTPPLLTISGGSLNLGCNPDPEDINAALGVASAFDACASPTLLTSTGAVVANGCNRSQTRTFTSTDACGNFASATRTAIWVADPTPPVFIGNYGTVNLGCNPAAFLITAALGGATATDACGAPTLVASDGAIVSNGCNRTQTRTFTAIDACGNISIVSRTVNWFADITPPVLTISGPSNLGCNPDPEEINAALGVASAFDGCALPTLVTTTGAVVTNGCNRSQTRTFTSIDACGNFASASRTVTWIVDVSPPVFIGDYSTVNLGVDPDPADISAALDGATAFDACGVPTLTFSNGPVISNDCDRSQTRTFTAIDGCANISTISRTVIWLCGQTRLFPTNPKIRASISPFNVKAYPNPTEHQFTLYLEGASNEKVAIVVYDAIGRQVKKIERGDASGAIKFGEDLKVGVYFVEVRHGINRKTLKLVKQ